MDKKTRARIYYAAAVDLFKTDSEDKCNQAIELLDKEVCLDQKYLPLGARDDPLYTEADLLRGDIWHSLIRLNWDNYYPKYLASPAWKKKRGNVMSRDNSRCACGAKAEHVHHKTYDNVGKEPLYDLVSLCEKCHDRYHT